MARALAASRRVYRLAAAALIALAAVVAFYAVSAAMAPRLEFEVAGAAPDFGRGVVRVVVKIKNPTPIDYRVEGLQAVITLDNGFSVKAEGEGSVVVPAHGTAAAELYFDLGLSEIIAFVASEGRAEVELTAIAKPTIGPLELPGVPISKSASAR